MEAKSSEYIPKIQLPYSVWSNTTDFQQDTEVPFYHTLPHIQNHLVLILTDAPSPYQLLRKYPIPLYIKLENLPQYALHFHPF
jgi:hypothetical protein